MSEIAIDVQNLSKRYRIGLAEEQHDTLASAVVAWVRSPLDNFRNLKKLSHFKDDESLDVMYALRDVSFQVKQGEVLGVIGRNGAGKSTLLKILSRITDPTSGHVEIRGRVSSLLEVGTGFHPELTGRENVYLNGTILGMTKAEVDRKFDEIVAFSEVEKFIDTPVKRYSSGMRVRLAFAVAAHLDPEILLVDEVLAVGDLAFQRKCLGKMDDVAKTGRTVLFVSHNMAMVAQLCQTGLVLEGGRVQMRGEAGEAINAYVQNVLEQPASAEDWGHKDLYVDSFQILNGTDTLDTTSPTRVRFRIHVRRQFWQMVASFTLSNAEQTTVVREFIRAPDDYPELLEPGVHEIELELPPLWLTFGQYVGSIKVAGHGIGEKERFETDPLFFSAKGGTTNRTGKGALPVLTPSCDWTIQPVAETHNA